MLTHNAFPRYVQAMTHDASSQLRRGFAGSANKLYAQLALPPAVLGWWSSPALARTMPFVLFMCVLALRGVAVQLAPNFDSFDVRWLYGVQAALAFLAMLLWRRSYRELHCVPLSAPLAALSISAGLIVFVLWIAPMPAWMQLGDPVASFVPVDDGSALRWDLITVRVFGAALVVPLMEELFWRSFLMRWVEHRDFRNLAPDCVSWRAIVLTSAAFALAHNLWLAAFVAGLTYAFVYRRSGNLWYAILAHATTNGLLALWVVQKEKWNYW